MLRRSACSCSLVTHEDVVERLSTGLLEGLEHGLVAILRGGRDCALCGGITTNQALRGNLGLARRRSDALGARGSSRTTCRVPCGCRLVELANHLLAKACSPVSASSTQRYKLEGPGYVHRLLNKGIRGRGDLSGLDGGVGPRVGSFQCLINQVSVAHSFLYCTEGGAGIPTAPVDPAEIKELGLCAVVLEPVAMAFPGPAA